MYSLLHHLSSLTPAGRQSQGKVQGRVAMAIDNSLPELWTLMVILIQGRCLKSYVSCLCCQAGSNLCAEQTTTWACCMVGSSPGACWILAVYLRPAPYSCGQEATGVFTSSPQVSKVIGIWRALITEQAEIPFHTHLYLLLVPSCSYWRCWTALTTFTR